MEGREREEKRWAEEGREGEGKWHPPGASTPYKRWSKCTMKKIGGGKVFAGT